MADSQINRYTVPILAMLSILGFAKTWGALFANGHLGSLLKAYYKDEDEYVSALRVSLPSLFMPGAPLYVNRLGALYGTIFTRLIYEGSANGKLYAFHYLGQLTSVAFTVVLEAMRPGHEKTTIIRWIVWLYLAYWLGFGAVMPLWTVFHLVESPTARRTSKEVAAALTIIPEDGVPNLQGWVPFPQAIADSNASVVGSLGILAWPRFPYATSNLLYSLQMIWRLIPFVFMLVPITLTTFVKGLLDVEISREPYGHIPSEWKKTSRSIASRTLHSSHKFGMYFGVITHWITMFILILRTIIPWIFSKRLRTLLTFSGVFRSDIPVGSADTTGEFLNFLQIDQYIGFLAIIIWSEAMRLHMYPVITSYFQYAVSIVMKLGFILIMGPAHTMFIAVLSRDQEILADERLM